MDSNGKDMCVKDSYVMKSGCERTDRQRRVVPGINTGKCGFCCFHGRKRQGIGANGYFKGKYTGYFFYLLGVFVLFAVTSSIPTQKDQCCNQKNKLSQKRAGLFSC